MQKRKRQNLSLFGNLQRRETDADGKVKYLRNFEYLNLFLIEKPKTDA